ncbi:hypothetical protein GCM10027048_38780 [Hymenobacter coalescens]
MTPAATKWLTPALQAVDERRALRHGLFWGADVAFMMWLFQYVHHVTPNLGMALRDALLLVAGTHLPATYALLYGVLPVLWREKRDRLSLLMRLAGWICLALALNYTFRFFVLVPLRAGLPSTFPDYQGVFASGSHMPLLLIAGVAACLRVYREWRQKQLANAQLNQQNYQAELQLLQAQIHPHFLFNTLNNLYALTLKQSSQAPAVVERLTGLLHFVVEQGSAPSVALRDEVALLRNYVALEQLRYGTRLTVEFEAAAMPADGCIAPLLLLPLVENAFKHGSAEQVGQAHIRVALAVSGNLFTCLISNTKNAEPAAGEPAGIGLRNVRQRLELLYPQRHRLEVEARAETFAVRLELQLTVAAATHAPAAVAERPVAARWSVPAQPHVSRLLQP